ncbi:hypothetical protein ACFVR1_05000 [Psychrobacillus sp. NPDC058041]
MSFIIGLLIILVIILLFSLSAIENMLKTIVNQNERVTELLTEIKDKK